MAWIIASKQRIGIFLASLGVFFLLLNFLRLGWLFALILSFILLFVGSLKRESLWIMPGSLLLSIAIAMFMVNGPVQLVAEEFTGTIFMLIASMGWFGVNFFTRRNSREPIYWTFIPGSLMVFLGWLSINLGWLAYPLDWLSRFWPSSLIALGAYIVVEARLELAPKAEEEKKPV